ncbi:MAG: precorrin-6A/cobalt-precorrin-6A reductase [Lachnospiraceae bacterium]|nr:precorrin-6A/cobalt-precorrin-6A reductase [Lachnospiraceae bacterium]
MVIHMDKALIFGGTTEGRLLYTYCARHDIPAIVCVATEYGERLLQREANSASVSIHEGRLTLVQMQELMRREKPRLVLDATHPYAALVTENIKEACRTAHIPYRRVVRADAGDVQEEPGGGQTRSSVRTETEDGADKAAETGIFLFDSIEEAVCFLEKQTGNIFVTTGSKELWKYQELTAFRDRVYVRILPQPEMVAACIALGIEGRHLNAMQGPFSEEMNYAYITEFDIQWMVTKQSGEAGGFYEKREAARRAGISLIIIRRKETESGLREAESGISALEAMRLLEGRM